MRPMWGLALALYAFSSLAAAEPPPTFERDIEPILARFGCNASGCHGKAEGQNGFKLSVFGFDPDADYRALAQESRGRRVFPAAPEQSLLLQKASGVRPHGGGVRIDADRPEYDVVRRWIAAGLPRTPGDAPQVVKIAFDKSEATAAPGSSLALRVTATWSDGRTSDVTALARFQSNNDGLAAVDDQGVVTLGQNPGVAAIMASYLGQVAVFQALIPRSEPLVDVAYPAEQNFIDGHVYRRLRELHILPAEVCTDAEFLRRAHLDLIGKLPTAAEARAFLGDARSDRRARLVDALLERSEFADYWALKLADWIRVDRQTVGHKAAYEQHRWLRESLAANKPLDQLTREIVTAEGPLTESPQGNFFKTFAEPGKAASAIAQVFLGVRIECAQCHHHPYDRWGQDDYASLAAYFAPLKREKSTHGELLVAGGAATFAHPRTGAVMTPRPLGAPASTADKAAAAALPPDPRPALATWLTAAENPYFARHSANRVWAHLLGRGLVEPVDDFRLTNPPSNPALLDALAARLVADKYDLKALLRTICASRTYQHSAATNATNAGDHQNYARFWLKRLEAEVLLDAVCDVTGVPEKFEGTTAGVRAVELWDSQVDHYFLRLFGRPTRQTVCECERVGEPSVAQVMHLLNSQRVQDKLASPAGRIRALARAVKDDAALVDELYLTVFARPPSAAERQAALAHLQRSAARDEGVEDVAWSLLNSLEFVFNH